MTEGAGDRTMDPTTYVCLDCNDSFTEPHETCPECGEEMSPNAKVPPGVRYGTFVLRTDCSRCGQPLPLNGPQLEVECAACGHVSRFGPERWKSLLEDLDNDYDDYGWADSSSSTVMTGDGTFNVQEGRQLPHCPSCHKAIPSYGIEVGTDTDLTCPKCGATVTTFPAPDWLREAMPSARQLYGAERVAGSAPPGAVEVETPEAARPVVMQCPQCGGTLKVTAESERLVPCSYCDVDVYLPDDLWRRLHPVKTANRWMVRFEGKSVGQLEEEQEDEEDEEETVEDFDELLSDALDTRPDRDLGAAARSREVRPDADRATKLILLAGLVAALTVGATLCFVALSNG